MDYYYNEESQFDEMPQEPTNQDDQDPDIQIVGSIPGGISAACWSPDEEILAIATNSNTFVLLTRFFEPISEATITTKDLKLSKHVSVGWGKKETQFEGRGAKALRDPTMPEHVDLGLLNESDFIDPKTCEISWRGDGEVVSVSCIDKLENGAGERRTIRVYTRDGTLNSVTEPVDYLTNATAWRPSGNLIASIQRKDQLGQIKTPQVVFFERNGLRRGQFSLRLPENDESLAIFCPAWNTDSDCLALIVGNTIQIWTTKNYHWYLKQELSSPGFTPSKIIWHPEQSHTLIAISSASNSILFYDFQWDITRGTTAPDTDIGLVAVVDGKNLKLTPLAIANTPPPMAFRTFTQLEMTPTHVAVSKSNEILAILSGSNLIIAKWNPTIMKNGGLVRNIKTPEVVNSFAIDELQIFEQPKQLAFIGDDYLAIAVDHETDFSSASTSSEIVIAKFSSDHKSLEVVSSHTTNEQVYLLKSLPTADNAVFETLNGTVYSFSGNNYSQVNRITKLPKRCDAIEVYFPNTENDLPSFGDVDEYEEGAAGQSFYQNNINDPSTAIVFGLHKNGKLYANTKQIASSATSLCMTDRYLAFTTAQHYLKFCHLAQYPELISVPSDSSVDDERCRAIERGSLIVTAMPSKSSFTLQAPRGNLETFYPRIMTLAGVRQYIKEKRYDLAFSLCRVHRIDLNILYDYMPEQFLELTELFISQMKTPEYIDLFVSGLQEEDVSLTKYKDTIKEIENTPQTIPGLESEAWNLPGKMEGLSINESINGAKENSTAKKNKKDVPVTNGKVNKICDAFISILNTDKYKVQFNQSILTSYACKTPPALEEALALAGKTMTSDPELTNISIQHLCFLQDVNLLYDTALGIYDLPLTLLIAQQSTKDPKEYLPFLRNLQSLDPLRRKFEIDTYLKRYSKALISLSQIEGEDAFLELQDYVIDHNLYTQALEIFKYNQPKQDKILELQAEYFYKQAEYQKSGLIYEMLGQYTSALDSYKLGTCWEQALSIIDRNPDGTFDAEKILQVADELADKTYDAHDYKASATIQLHYLSNPVEACKSLCKGFFFNDAIMIASRYTTGPNAKSTYKEILESTLEPGLMEGFNQISELLADCNSQINSQLARLRELREKKLQDPFAFFGGNTNAQESEILDNVSIAPSETSTAPSFFTQYTGKTGGTAQTGASRRTAKNRRREERKRARGKKGSVYEEEYLINSMGRLIERLHEVQPDALKLIDGLLRCNKRTHAYQIQKEYKKIMETLEGCAEEVFFLSLKDRERINEDDGTVYYIEQREIPTIKKFPVNEILDY